jgi:diguanylate cyclase (GGDEF)-like protein
MNPDVADHLPPPLGAAMQDSRLVPWPAFAVAAEAAVEHLSRALGLDLWLVTHVDEDRQVIVAASGHWAELAAPGTHFSWQESFCLPMTDQRGPTVALDVREVPAYAPLATGILARVRAYVGMPLYGRDGELFGTLCAFAGRPQPAALAEGLDLMRLVGRLLSTILSTEQLAVERSTEAATAYALAERDRLTGLPNHRGWKSALGREDYRCHRYGAKASVLVLNLHDMKRTNDADGYDAGDRRLVQCARVLAAVSRPADVQARLDSDEFGLLAVECDAASARTLLARLRLQLRAAGVAAAAGSASSRVGEDLTMTFERAQQAMYRDKRRRELRRLSVTQRRRPARPQP